MLSKSLIQFYADEWGCVPSLFVSGQTMVGVMVVMTASFKRTYARLLHSDPTAGYCPPKPPQETPGHSQQACLSLLWSHVFSPGSWWAQGFVCALQEPVSPVLWKFCNQIPLASKVKFPGGSQPLCWTPRLGNLVWVLELWQQCRNFFGTSFSSLWAVCSVALWWGSHAAPLRSAAARSPVRAAGHC